MIKILQSLLLCLYLFVNNSSVVAATCDCSSLANLIEVAGPAVVSILSTQVVSSRSLMNEDGQLDLFEFFEREFGGKEWGEKKRKTKYLGSGFLIDPKGYIVTNYHVVEGAEEIEVILNGEHAQTYKAKVIGRDKRTDLILLKIDSKEALPYLKFGNSDEARVGDRVVAIGSPFGLHSTATSGIISAKARYLANQFDDYIQTDAAINRGNSGGPMLDLLGKVIGINTVILSPSGGSIGIGFAIPSNLASYVINQLMEKGEVVRGWLGVKIQPINQELAESLGLPSTEGALIGEITPGSPAEKAGLKIGDVIVRFDGISIADSNKLSKVVASTTLDKQVIVEIYRAKKNMQLKAKIGKLEMDPDEAEQNAERESFNQNNNQDGVIAILDMKIKNINDTLRKKYKIAEGINGALVIGVKPDGITAAAKIKVGDVIVQVNQDKVLSAQDFKEKIEESMKQKSKGVALLVANSFGSYFVFLSFE